MMSLATSYPDIESAVWLLYTIPNVPTALGFIAIWYFRHRLWPLTLLLGILSICWGIVLAIMLGLGDLSLWTLIHPAVVTIGLGLCLCVASLKSLQNNNEADRLG